MKNQTDEKEAFWIGTIFGIFLGLGLLLPIGLLVHDAWVSAQSVYCSHRHHGHHHRV